MATSRPIRVGEWLTDIRTGSPFIGSNIRATIHEVRRPQGYILQSDFGLDGQVDDAYWQLMRERVFGITGDGDIPVAITSGTAPGLYVREGDDTSDWETYRQVLARRVEGAMAARRGGAGVGETVTTAAGAQTTSPLTRECHWCYNSRRITHSQDDEGRVCSYCFDWPEVVQAREGAVARAAARAMPTVTTRQDDEIRVGDVVEVVSCRNIDWTTPVDVGGRGRVNGIDKDMGFVRLDTQPREWIAAIVDVRKVSSPSPQNASVTFSPMPDGEVVRIATPEEVRSSMTAQGHIVNNPSPPTDARTSINFVDVPTISAAEAYRRFATDDRRLSNVPQPSSRPTPQPSSPQPSTPPSRFSLLEVDLPPEPTSPISRSLDADLAALQGELRIERERNRAQAAAQMQKSRFDLLECDLPAVPVAAAPVAAVAVKASSRPVASSPPKPHNPVETITDLTAARSPLELARMLEGLNDELSTMMRQREAN